MAQRITLDFLSEQGACSDQMELFTELFPDGTEVTEELCTRYAEEFDFYWALENLLPEEAKAECVRINDEAWAECQRIDEEAWAEYHRIQNEAWQECLRTRGEALTQYPRIQNEAWAEYERSRDKALAEFRRVCATEFARLWNKYMP